MIPLFGVSSHTEKLGDEEMLQMMGRRFLRINLRDLPVLRRLQAGSEFVHVEYPWILVASLGIVSGSDGVQERIASKLKLFAGKCRINFAVLRAACHCE